MGQAFLVKSLTHSNLFTWSNTHSSYLLCCSTILVIVQPVKKNITKALSYGYLQEVKRLGTTQK